MVSILILTLNEEAEIAACLESVAWSDDIHVLDSFSRDQTAAIATQAGATVTQRKFDNWASHQNWALASIPFKHPWVFYLDADERVTPTLRDAILATVAASPAHAGFNVQRRDFMNGRWLKHVQATSMYLRLFRPQALRYERLVNPISILDGTLGTLPGYLDHFPFSKGVSHWIQRHNSYSTFEALQTRNERRNFSWHKALFSKDSHERRANQKGIFYKLPGRPIVKFLVFYIAKRGFLDGRPGLQYSILQSIYEYFIVLKESEISQNQTP